MAKNEIIVEVTIDSKQAEANAAKLAQTLFEQRKELAKVREEFKASNGTNLEAAKRMNALEEAVKATTTELNQERKAMVANANSLEALRAITNQMTRERNGLNTGIKEQADRYKELTEQIKANNELINEQSKAAGSFKDNIGNYAGSIKEAIAGNQMFGSSFTQFVEITNIASQTFKQLNIVIAANPLGLLLVVLTAIIGAFALFLTRTEEGRRAFAKFTTGAAFAFNKLAELIIQGSKAIVDFAILLYEEPGKAFDKLKDATIEYYKFLFDGWVNIGRLIRGAVTFDNALFEEALNALKEQLKQVVAPAADLYNKIKDAAEAGAEAEDKMRRLKAAIRSLGIETEKYNKISEQQKLLADDDTKKLLERIEAINKAEEAEQEYTKSRTALVQARIALLNLEIQKAGIAGEEQKDQLAELRAELEAIGGEAAERLAEIQGTRNSLVKELKEQSGAVVASVREVSDAVVAESTKLQAALLSVSELQTELAGEELSQFQKDMQARLDSLAREAQAKKDAAEAEKLRNEQLAQSRQEMTDAINSATQSALDFTLSAFGKETKAYKALLAVQRAATIASMTIKLQEQLQNIRTKAAELGLPLGPIYAGVNTASAIIQYVVGTAKVAAAGFKKGGYTGAGSDDEVAGQVHKNEVVIPAPVVRKYGVDFFTSFIDGAPMRPSPTAAIAEQGRISREQAIYVAVTDINKGQQRYAQVAELANS